MSHGKSALTLMMVLALPSAAQALGLGEIHLDSALNEPLAADIDIVGATAEDLAGISASIANKETFAHFGLDRPAFLSTVALKISHDSQGRVVLAIRTTDACTEPLLDMLVDIRWRGGELIRHYTLLLDPPGFHSVTPLAATVVGAPASYTVPLSVASAPTKALIETSKASVEAAPTAEKTSTRASDPAARKRVRVGAKATLRGVAWRVGARSDADLKRMMIAIFHANPNAFEGNINRLRRGALLAIPSKTEASAISVANADQEVHAQMQAWHPSTPGLAATKSVTLPVAAPISPARETAVPSGPAAGSAQSAATAPATEPVVAAEPAGAHRVEQLEEGHEELPAPLEREHAAFVPAQPQLSVAEEAPAELAPPPASSGGGLGSSIAAILALAAAAFGTYAWRRRRALRSQRSPVDPKSQDLAPVKVEVAVQATVREAVAPSRPLSVEAHDVPHQTHDAPSVAPPNAETGERQWVAEALARRRDSVATEPSKLANPIVAIDLESLELSYRLQDGGGLEDTVEFCDLDKTARLPAPAGLGADDSTAEMMPAEMAAILGLPEATMRALSVPENARPATTAAADASKLDYDLLDLDAPVQHVQMPSDLHENVRFKERRTSLVDALKSAVEREPHRHDLRMKLLETYFAAAATNRQGFLDVVQKIARERASLSEGDWDKITRMGRQIASDDDLFAPSEAQPDEENLANCA